MRTPAIRPRVDQVSELSRGLNLPLAAIEDDLLAVIAQGLERAFNDIQASAPQIVSSGTEAEVTALLETRLNALIEIEPLWRQLVLCVARGKESLSVDGSHLEKRPDLSIFLTSRARAFPLVAEAKIIDSASGKTELLYCSQGVRRFLIGEYGWGGREAFLLAYVRDGSAILTKLVPMLAAPSQGSKDYATEAGPAPHAIGVKDSARSQHTRSFVYAHQPAPNDQPGSIGLWHIWLS